MALITEFQNNHRKGKSGQCHSSFCRSKNASCAPNSYGCCRCRCTQGTFYIANTCRTPPTTKVTTKQTTTTRKTPTTTPKPPTTSRRLSTTSGRKPPTTTHRPATTKSTISTAQLTQTSSSHVSTSKATTSRSIKTRKNPSKKSHPISKLLILSKFPRSKRESVSSESCFNVH